MLDVCDLVCGLEALLTRPAVHATDPTLVFAFPSMHASSACTVSSHVTVLHSMPCCTTLKPRSLPAAAQQPAAVNQDPRPSFSDSHEPIDQHNGLCHSDNQQRLPAQDRLQGQHGVGDWI